MTLESNKIFKLLSHGLTKGNEFLPGDDFAKNLVKDCLDLFERDNICCILDNTQSTLCSTYPPFIIIPIEQKIFGETSSQSCNNDHNIEITRLIHEARFARTRGRFPAPVLIFGKKFVCRSSTLARSPEIYGRMGYQYLVQGKSTATTGSADETQQNGIGPEESSNSNGGIAVSAAYPAAQPSVILNNIQSNHEQSTTISENIQDGTTKTSQSILLTSSSSSSDNIVDQNTEWLVDRMRNIDLRLLNELGINTICDLMVENNKVKYWMNLTSSEKVDHQQRYFKLHLLITPYPGCEFFTNYSQADYNSVGLKFDWTPEYIDAKLQLPQSMKTLCDVDWEKYMDWDVVELTQSYLLLILKNLVSSSSSGILLHCISGWDRTPLFVSLVRLSLWADDLIHQSLNAEEIVYLTLAYDWLLFSHQLMDRVKSKEEIMHFCFNFLKFISSERYSLLPQLTTVDPNKELYYDANDSWENFKPSEESLTKASNPSTSDQREVCQCIKAIVETVSNQDIHSSHSHSLMQKSSPISIPSGNCTSTNNNGAGESGAASSDRINYTAGSRRSNNLQHISLYDSYQSCQRKQSKTFNITMDSSHLELKLKERKTRLEMAEKAMIPAYCEVIKEQMPLLQKQRGTLLTFLGHIAQLVKRG